MVKYKELRKILNSANMSVKHYQNGKTAVTDSSCFRGMNTSLLEEAQELVEEAVKDDTETFARKANIQLDSLQTVVKRAEANIGVIMDCLQSKTPMTAQEIREKASSPRGIRDSIFNGRWNINNAADPATANVTNTNIYLSPWRATL